MRTERARALAGFTLLEVVLAIGLSGLAVLVGALLWRQSLVAGTALTDHRVAVDREAGARRWLQSAIGSIDVGAEGDAPFTGHPDRVSFSTWLPNVNGWSERGTITLAADKGEPPRDCRRLPTVRGWSHGQAHTIFPRSAGAGGAAGAGARA